MGLNCFTAQVLRWQLSLSRPIQSDHWAGTFSWYPVHSWKAGPGEVMTVENLLFNLFIMKLLTKAGVRLDNS